MSRKSWKIHAVRSGDQPLDDLKPIRPGAVALAGLTATLLAFAGAATADPGDLDPNFNGSGLLSLSVGNNRSSATAVIQQTDGQLVLAGWGVSDGSDNEDFILMRVAEDGTRESTFGTNGVASADFTAGLDYANAGIQQADGKLVLAGEAGVGRGRADIALARFRADGTLDSTFGAGGRTTLNLGYRDIASGLIQQPDGKLVVAGTTTNSSGSERMVFARFNADGTLDTTFGAGGTTTVDFGDSESWANDLAQQPDGKLVAVGAGFSIARLTANGALDPSFDGDGLLARAMAGDATTVAIQPDGGIIAAGYALPPGGDKFGAALLRVNGDGSLDNNFGSAGQVFVDLGNPSDLSSIIVQADGRIVGAGTRFVDGDEMILARFNSDGTLDTNYGIDGVATADFGTGATAPDSHGAALIQQIDGKYVAVGSIASYPFGAFGAARFDDDATFPGRIGLTRTDRSVGESMPTVTYTVRRTGGRTGTVSVGHATTAGDAQPGADFEAASGTFIWGDGDASVKTLTVDIIDDDLAEAIRENFTLTLSAPTGGVELAASEAPTTIFDDDGPGELRLCIDACFGWSPDVVKEADPVYNDVSVVRTGGSTGAISVEFTTSAQTATPGMDYTETIGTFNWDDGEILAKRISVPILDDAVVEDLEHFQIRLSNPTGGATIRGGFQRVYVEIADNDPGLGFTSSTATIGEAEGSVSLIVSRTSGSRGALSVNYATSSGSATTGSDFTAANGALDWGDGDTADKTITVDVTNDSAEELSENFIVTLSNPSGGAQLRENANATVTIADDDADDDAPLPRAGGGGSSDGILFGLLLLGLARKRGISCLTHCHPLPS